jgi:hydrogenase nickel incorporation protein HypA/HybF
MHELSIADAIAAIVRRHAGGRTVTRVDVRVGHLRQVVPSSLEFSFQLVTAGTECDGAELVIEAVPAAGRCRACGAESEQDGFPLRCTSCGGLDLEITRGEELLVDALELDDEMTTTTGGLVHGR